MFIWLFYKSYFTLYIHKFQKVTETAIIIIWLVEDYHLFVFSLQL